MESRLQASQGDESDLRFKSCYLVGKDEISLSALCTRLHDGDH